MEMTYLERIRYLSEQLGVSCRPEHQLTGCADALSRDPSRWDGLAPLIRPFANELILIAEAQLESWEMTRAAMHEGAALMPNTPDGTPLVADEHNEATSRITELSIFIEWLSPP